MTLKEDLQAHIETCKKEDPILTRGDIRTIEIHYCAGAAGALRATKNDLPRGLTSQAFNYIRDLSHKIKDLQLEAYYDKARRPT